MPRDLGNRLLDIVKLDDYQEPYQALKYAPYYSYSTVVMEMKDMMLNNKGTNINHSGTPCSNTLATALFYTNTRRAYKAARARPHLYGAETLNARYEYAVSLVHVRVQRTTKHSPDRNQYTATPPPLARCCAQSSFAISSAAVYANGAVDTSYDYAVPELGTVPLLNQDGTGRGPAVSSGASDQDSLFSKTAARGTKTEDKKVSLRPCGWVEQIQGYRCRYRDIERYC